MIEEIFKIIMTEARSRQGKDLAKNIAIVLVEVNAKVMDVIKAMDDQERREKESEI